MHVLSSSLRSHDRLDQLVTETASPFGSRTFQYDPAGNLLQETDRNGRVTQYVYDPAGREVEERWLDGSQETIHAIRSWYDAAGQLVGVTETDAASAAAATNYQYVYDPVGNLTRMRVAPGDYGQPSPTVIESQLGDGGDGWGNWDQREQKGTFYFFSHGRGRGVRPPLDVRAESRSSVDIQLVRDDRKRQKVALIDEIGIPP